MEPSVTVSVTLGHGDDRHGNRYANGHWHWAGAAGSAAWRGGRRVLRWRGRVRLMPEPDAPARPPVIALRNVTRTYRMGEVEVNALRGVSLVVQPGEFVAIMGTLRIGKTTMMNIIGCLDVARPAAVLARRRRRPQLDELGAGPDP